MKATLKGLVYSYIAFCYLVRPRSVNISVKPGIFFFLFGRGTDLGERGCEERNWEEWKKGKLQLRITIFKKVAIYHFRLLF